MSHRTKSEASSLCSEPSRTAAGYEATAFCASGTATVVTLPPAAAASVTYTRPASASPSSTLLSTARTFGSWETGFTFTPAPSRIFWL